LNGSTVRSHRHALGATLGKLAAVVLVSAALVAGPGSVRPMKAAGAAEADRTAGAASVGSNVTTASDWPVYHMNAQRTGNDPSFPTFAGSLAAGWSTALDGAVYAEPLVVNGTVIAATEGDSVYAIDPAAGTILWRRNVGTPVPLSSLPCGDIDPLGITGTPAYDSVTGSLFVVAEVTGFHHILFALDPTTGAVRWSRTVDLAGDDPRTHQQRPALAVANGYVYIGFGGLAGDCGQYVGEVVGVPASGTGVTISYRVPVSREGAVWATGGPVIDASGNLYVSVGNGASTGTYDGSDSVIELSPTLQLESFFAPSTWASDNAGDKDLGSLSPVLVPGGWVFIAGKSGTGYVLSQGSLGGIGGQVSSATVCTGFGGAALNGDTVYVPCSGSLREVQIGSNGSLTPGWQTSAAGGPPVIGGGVVWSVNTSAGRLVALDPATGATVGTLAVGAVPHFVSPTLWQEQVLVGTTAGITSASVSAPAASLDVSGLASPRTAGSAGMIAVSALDASSHVATGYRGRIHFTSSDPTATLPADYTFTAADDGSHDFSVTLESVGTSSVTATDTATGTIMGTQGGIAVDPSGASYFTVLPARVLDSRPGTGHIGAALFHSHTKQTFAVATPASGVPAKAVAVSGNVTVTGQTRAGFVTVAPSLTSGVVPSTSTINFPLGDTRANGVTVALGAGGNLDAMYWSSSSADTVNVIFDVEGYFL
jgi:outer membrane protein assembly factor BamB